MKRGSVSAAVRAASLGLVVSAGIFAHPFDARAQTPFLVDPSLVVSTVVGGLSQPIAMAFIGPNDILVTEKASGQVKRVTNGVRWANPFEVRRPSPQGQGGRQPRP